MVVVVVTIEAVVAPNPIMPRAHPSVLPISASDAQTETRGALLKSHHIIIYVVVAVNVSVVVAAAAGVMPSNQQPLVAIATYFAWPCGLHAKIRAPLQWKLTDHSIGAKENEKETYHF